MKVKCTRDLWSHQEPGCSSWLSEKPFEDRDPVFKKGEEYEMVFVQSGNLLNGKYLQIFAAGDDGKYYRVFNQVICIGTDTKLDKFDFSEIEKLVEEKRL